MLVLLHARRRRLVCCFLVDASLPELSAAILVARYGAIAAGTTARATVALFYHFFFITVSCSCFETLIVSILLYIIEDFITLMS